MSKRMDKTDTSPISGLVVAIEDNICMLDTPTTCGSKMLEGFRPTYDATVASRLREQGAVLMSTTNPNEFGIGQTCEATDAVADGDTFCGLAVDVGGSLRHSVLSRGLVGYKPSYGAVSRYGLIACSGSFDQIGAIGRRVSDVALLMGAVAGHDVRDAVTSPAFVPDFSGISAFDVKGKKIGVLKECFGNDLSGDVLTAAQVYESLGAEFVEVSIPSIYDCLPAYYAMALAETSSSLAKFDGVRFGHRSAQCADMDSLYINSRTEGLGDEIKRRILIGTYLLSSGQYEIYYKKARVFRTMLQEAFIRAFAECDVLLTPVVGDLCTIPANFAGLPAIVLPCGAADVEGLPNGAQLIGQRFGDADLLGFAYALEQAIDPGEVA